jgi:hypothetical protein
MLQQALITAHISLQRLDDKDVKIFRDHVLPPTKLAFTRLRRDIDLTIREIGASLGCGPMFIEATQSGYLELLDQQRAASDAGKPQPLRHSTSERTLFEKAHEIVPEKKRKNSTTDRDEVKEERIDLRTNLFNVAKRLQQELGAETPARSEYTRPSTPTTQTPHSPVVGGATPGETTAVTTPHNTKVQNSPTSNKHILPFTSTGGQPTQSSKPKYGPTRMKAHFEEFETAQKEVFTHLLTTTEEFEGAQLRVHEPGPSISELYGGDYLRGDAEEGDLPDQKEKKNKTQIPPSSSAKPGTASELEEGVAKLANEHVEDESGGEESDDSEDSDVDGSNEPTPQFKRNETLVRVYSLLFAWEYVSPIYLLDVGTDRCLVILSKR